MALRCVLVTLLLTIGCGGTEPRAVSAPPVDASKPRAVLMHGLHGGIEQFDEPPYNALVTGLKDQGWQVVFVEYPEDNAPDPVEDLARRLRDDPAKYRAESIAQIRELIGTGTGPVLLGGISWGGWHTLATADLPGVTGWFVHAPVTRINVLEEFADIDTTAADVTSIENATAPGFVRWCTGDDRVSGALARPVAESSGGPVEVQSVDQGHETTTADVAAVLEWTRGLREPA